MQKSYDSATVKKLDKSRVEITGSIPSDIWETFHKQALENLNESVTLDGFRKGMVPESILVSKVGDMAVLEEIAELALSRAYVDIIIDNKLDAIGKPSIQVTKLAKGNPIEFKLITSVVPEITLPDYKKIASEEIRKQNPDDEKFTEKEFENTIKRIQSAATPHTKASSDGSGGHSPDHEKMAPHTVTEEDETNLPELTDDYVKKLGAFSSVSDFKEKVRDMLTEQKRGEARDKRRIRIADAIASASTLELPDILIESEINRIEAQFKVDIERMGVKLEDYMKHAKKTLEEIRREWRPHAEKKARLQLVLNAIAQKENISPDPREVEAEVKHILEHHKDADRERAQIYAETVLTNEKVFRFLENPS